MAFGRSKSKSGSGEQPTGKYFKMQYSFQPQKAGELSANADDVVAELVSDADADWLYCCKTTRRGTSYQPVLDQFGYVPRNYTEPVLVADPTSPKQTPGKAASYPTPVPGHQANPLSQDTSGLPEHITEILTRFDTLYQEAEQRRTDKFDALRQFTENMSSHVNQIAETKQTIQAKMSELNETLQQWSTEIEEARANLEAIQKESA